MRLYLVGAACAGVLALIAALWLSLARNDRLRDEVAASRANVAALQLDRELARDAAAVADARAARVEAKAREYDQLREGILRDGEDADLPDWLLDVLVGLRAGANAADQPANSE
ncbi:hypothetical protein [Roseicyclus sp.]|uniref:hypothetical protein n=1 Tax=Roseicyclus sp. TaxID=1914329 RepID=UPI003F6AEA4E